MKPRTAPQHVVHYYLIAGSHHSGAHGVTRPTTQGAPGFASGYGAAGGGRWARPL